MILLLGIQNSAMDLLSPDLSADNFPDAREAFDVVGAIMDAGVDWGLNFVHGVQVTDNASMKRWLY